MSTILTALALVAAATPGLLISPAELAVTRHLGYDARLYDGSIVDWTTRNLPAVTGPQIKH